MVRLEAWFRASNSSSSPHVATMLPQAEDASRALGHARSPDTNYWYTFQQFSEQGFPSISLDMI